MKDFDLSRPGVTPEAALRELNLWLHKGISPDGPQQVRVLHPDGAHSIAAGVDAVTVFAGEGPRMIVDQKARTAAALANSFAACLRASHHPKLVLGFDAVLVVGPEHARVLADDGWDRQRLLDELHARLQIHGSDLVTGAHGMAEGVPDHLADAVLPKFRPDGILVVHAGGEAGLFSAIIGGWANGDIGSRPVTVEVHR